MRYIRLQSCRQQHDGPCVKPLIALQRVKDVTRYMGAAGRMACEQNTRNVAPKGRDSLGHPLHAQGYIINRSWKWEFWRKAVFKIDPDESLAGKPVQNVVVHARRVALFPSDKGASMDKDDYRCQLACDRVGRKPRYLGHEEVKHLSGVWPVDQIPLNSDSGLGGSSEQRRVRALYQVTVLAYVQMPARSNIG